MTNLLIGDRFIAECKKPIDKPKKESITLKKRAHCKIHKEAKQEEIDEVKIKFLDLCSKFLYKKDEKLSGLILHCLFSQANLKNIHKHHTGADRVKPFYIERTRKLVPVLCTDVQNIIPKISAEIILTK